MADDPSASLMTIGSERGFSGILWSLTKDRSIKFSCEPLSTSADVCDWVVPSFTLTERLSRFPCDCDLREKKAVANKGVFSFIGNECHSC